MNAVKNLHTDPISPSYDPTKVVLKSLKIQAVVKDLYDFDFTRLPSALFANSRTAAIVQIGWQPAARRGGKIFYTETEIDETYDEGWPVDLLNDVNHFNRQNAPLNTIR